MKLIAGIMLGWAVAAVAVAGPETRGKPEAACEKQAAQCMKQCDKEKRMWFFKGEAYESCAARCEARENECRATGMDEGEQSADRMRDRDAKGDKDDAAEAADEAVAEADEAAEAAEEADEAGEDEAADARERPRGKDRTGQDD